MCDELKPGELDKKRRLLGDMLRELPEPFRLSNEAIDILVQMLTIDPERRPTAQELLEHPWFEELKSIDTPM